MTGLSSLGGFVEIIGDVGPLEKVVLAVLLAMSVISWAIILHKALQFRMITAESSRFLKTYRESRRFSLVASGAKRLRQSPLGRVYLAAYQELSASGTPPPDVMDGPPEPGEEGISPDRLESVQRATRRVHASEIERMERYLPFLATTASAAPFIGLLGTVIGIMSSFHGIGTQGSASLAVVAPGISGRARRHRGRPGRGHSGRHRLQLLRRPGASLDNRDGQLHARVGQPDRAPARTEREALLGWRSRPTPARRVPAPAAPWPRSTSFRSSTWSSCCSSSSC